MAGRNASPSSPRRAPFEENSVLGTGLSTRQIEAFGRKVTSTASHLIGDASGSIHYSSAMAELQKELRRPGIQQRVFSYAKASPTELVRAKLSTSEIQHRALTHLSDELLNNIPQNDNIYSLFQGFQATLPETEESEHRKTHRRHHSKGQKLLEGVRDRDPKTPLEQAKRDRQKLEHNLEMMGVRKNMCSAEIREIDNKISNLGVMRKIVLERLENLEQDELRMEQELSELESKLEDLQEGAEEQVVQETPKTPPHEADYGSELVEVEDPAMGESFMSASIYEKLPSPKSKRQKGSRRRSAAIRHEHLEPGSNIKHVQAHNDMITSLDFDVPFGTMVTSALDDTVRVWDLNLGRCIGLLEGHQASVRCLQIEDSLVATGSMDASIRLWDLNQADYTPFQTPTSTIPEGNEDNDNDYEDLSSQSYSSSIQKRASPLSDCALLTLSAHVAEVTAIHLQGDMLVSGSADKTLRQWDLVKGRCVQTLDVLWAAAQASASINPVPESNSSLNLHSQWRSPGSRTLDASADFVGALQCFDAALACGTADGMVRLWDLRSGQVHRSLVGHTGAVTCLQFDEQALVTGSADRSIRIWDLRTGSIVDAYAYNHPVTSMMFDSRRIVAAAGEPVAKIYDRTDGRHWDCGPGSVSSSGSQGFEGDGEDVNDISDGQHVAATAIVERVRIKDGYLTEGRKDGVVGVWSC